MAKHLAVFLLLMPFCYAAFDETSLSKVTVGAYYYPWYGADFHKGAGYLRKEVGHTPALGEYDDSTPQLIRKHLDYSRQANIQLWVTSWWGRYSREDNTTRNVILPELLLQNSSHKVAVLYETTGRLNQEDGPRRVHRVTDDIEFILKHYVPHPNYYTIRNRPVVFVYLVSIITGLFCRVKPCSSITGS
jgi:hypothetical protein